MSINVFLSTVSDEFRSYRDQLRADLTRHNVAVRVQGDFKGLGGDTLDKLDVYMAAHCDAVVHLMGEMTGSAPGEEEQQALLRKYPDLLAMLPPLDEALWQGTKISYTQWEAWLALYHGKLLFIAKAEPAAPRGPKFLPTDQSREAQAAHLDRLKLMRRYPDFTFESVTDLSRHVAYTAILDLLVADHTRVAAVTRDVAEGLFEQPIQFYSCFISYSTKDQAFADRIYADPQHQGVRCWFAPHDLPIGAKILDEIDEAIRLRDKVILILSKHSIKSEWVENEITTAFEEERKRKQTVLFPIRLDNLVMLASEAWAAQLRARNIGDFRRWKDRNAYQQSFDRVLRDLAQTLKGS